MEAFGSVGKRSVGAGSALLAGAVSFAAFSFLAAPSRSQQFAAADGDHAGPVTPRVVVASGSSDTFGDWQLVVSKDADGNLCRGVLVRRPELPTPDLSEGCGLSDEDHIASLSGPEHGTLLYGRVPDDADRGDISSSNAAAMHANAIHGLDGHRYFVTSSARELHSPHVTLRNSKGAVVARSDP